mgnify:CR=1 FL=1
MANIVLTGDTSGAITFAAPAVAGTNTITLPANTGTAITSATAAADVPKPTALSTASGSAPSYSARAWVNFNGTGTVAISASGNVSSITDNGTGNYQVNFATAMPDANYSCAGSANDNAGLVTTYSGTYSTTTAIAYVVASTTGGAYDFSRVCVNYFR